jgi:hypothetical protein
MRCRPHRPDGFGSASAAWQSVRGEWRRRGSAPQPVRRPEARGRRGPSIPTPARHRPKRRKGRGGVSWSVFWSGTSDQAIGQRSYSIRGEDLARIGQFSRDGTAPDPRYGLQISPGEQARSSRRTPAFSTTADSRVSWELAYFTVQLISSPTIPVVTEPPPIVT